MYIVPLLLSLFANIYQSCGHNESVTTCHPVFNLLPNSPRPGSGAQVDSFILFSHIQISKIVSSTWSTSQKCFINYKELNSAWDVLNVSSRIQPSIKEWCEFSSKLNLIDVLCLFVLPKKVKYFLFLLLTLIYHLNMHLHTFFVAHFAFNFVPKNKKI